MNLVVMGAQWGDEGKGKIVDYLASEAETVIRFSGGANAGHTIVTNGVTYKLHLVPSGIIDKNKICLMGSAMVIDPEGLFNELDNLSNQGIDWKGRLFVSDRAHLVLPSYKQIDIEMDKKRKSPIGTTGRGIGVAYSQKASRDGFRVCDIFDEQMYSRLEDEDKVFLEKFKARLEPMVVNAAYFMAQRKGQKNLFEGAQGALLDLDGGTYPFVSSGFSCSAGAAIGGSVGPASLDKILGVFKAYQTRVGNGPFPSAFTKEKDGDLENTIREIGNEYGVTTGRPRKCGYLDLVALKYVCLTNSLSSLVLTHIDVYDGIDEVKACVAYDINGKITEEFPSTVSDLEAAKPVTKTFKGWNTSITGAKSYADLPKETQEYLEFIEEYTGTKISIISVGPDRDQTFNVDEPWTK
ncbi:MAG: adenylosuccinate synthase [Spirochaetales bacterium]|nr:adenylosuccinate synthase [Spirochaetales bacterium]